MMMTMAVDCFALPRLPTRAPSVATVSRPTRASALSLSDVARRGLEDAGGQSDSLQPQLLVRYAELKKAAPAQLQLWLETLSASQRAALRFILETVVVDCEGRTDALTAQPYVASEQQLKLVQQFDSDGHALWRLKLPRLNTLAAVDDALSEHEIAALSP